MNELRRWLLTSEAYDVLDDAVMGSLQMSTADEICGDFGVSRKQLSQAITWALAEGY